MGISHLLTESACYTSRMPATDGQSPPQSAIGGHSRTESDTVGQLFTLDVHQAQALFDAANLPRSLRSITRYCQTNRLDAVTVDGPNGPEWRISEASVTRAIDELKRVFSMSDTASHGEPWPAMSDLKNKDEISQDRPRHQSDRVRTQSDRELEAAATSSSSRSASRRRTT